MSTGVHDIGGLEDEFGPIDTREYGYQLWEMQVWYSFKLFVNQLIKPGSCHPGDIDTEGSDVHRRAEEVHGGPARTQGHDLLPQVGRGDGGGVPGEEDLQPRGSGGCSWLPVSVCDQSQVQSWAGGQGQGGGCEGEVAETSHQNSWLSVWISGSH